MIILVIDFTQSLLINQSPALALKSQQQVIDTGNKFEDSSMNRTRQNQVFRQRKQERVIEIRNIDKIITETVRNENPVQANNSHKSADLPKALLSKSITNGLNETDTVNVTKSSNNTGKSSKPKKVTLSDNIDNSDIKLDNSQSSES